jgi:hypothetical protein
MLSDFYTKRYYFLASDWSTSELRSLTEIVEYHDAEPFCFAEVTGSLHVRDADAFSHTNFVNPGGFIVRDKLSILVYPLPALTAEPELNWNANRYCIGKTLLAGT